ncbi:hypothetical protein NDU88_002692 [Pleurodeles waltl]|uniref:Uncharacterized protein n=1 Tax=Pleurodeles waltl TaxID=8319 RepID=A0AAV7UYG1_PLEWA|nr:hypothetical protein NDU88_002692 [Pleurodeles waltl]
MSSSHGIELEARWAPRGTLRTDPDNSAASGVRPRTFAGPVLPRAPLGVSAFCRDRPRVVRRARASVVFGSDLLRGWAPVSFSARAASRCCFRSALDSRQGRVSMSVLFLCFELSPMSSLDRLGGGYSWGSV